MMKEVTTRLSNCPYEIGDTVKFKPCNCVNASAGFGEELGRAVTATVVQIHEAHRWYRARYETPQGTRYETFKF